MPETTLIGGVTMALARAMREDESSTRPATLSPPHNTASLASMPPWEKPPSSSGIRGALARTAVRQLAKAARAAARPSGFSSKRSRGPRSICRARRSWSMGHQQQVPEARPSGPRGK